MGRLIDLDLFGFQYKVLETHFGWATGVQLQSEDTATSPRGIIQIHAELSVDIGLHLTAVRNNLIFVPFPFFDMLFTRLGPE